MNDVPDYPEYHRSHKKAEALTLNICIDNLLTFTQEHNNFHTEKISQNSQELHENGNSPAGGGGNCGCCNIFMKPLGG
jgi:hypothetical protein